LGIEGCHDWANAGENNSGRAKAFGQGEEGGCSGLTWPSEGGIFKGKETGRKMVWVKTKKEEMVREVFFSNLIQRFLSSNQKV
jgi:hypothetical protein